MEMLRIEGGRPLSGNVSISGSKNSSLPIMVATLLSNKQSRLHNVPDLADTTFLLELLRSFGASVERSDGVITIRPEEIKNTRAPYDVVRKMRASILVLAPLLARAGVAVVSLPGGCAIGTRPVDIHLAGLKALGADLLVKDGYIHARLESGTFKGAEFELSVPSVGATENLIMAAVLASGTTILKKAAKEPEVVELCLALNRAGARIEGIGTQTLIIEGVTSLSSIEHHVKPDRVEAGTFIAMAAATRSEITLDNVCLLDLENVMERFAFAGVQFTEIRRDGDLYPSLKVSPPRRIQATDIETAAHPGFPTDMQAQFMAAMTVAQGTSTIYERVFENRMMHVPELRRLGAHIEVKQGIARVKGQKRLSGAPVMATDLRASASLVIAALRADGISEIRRVYHLDRGYESLELKISKLNGKIERRLQKP